MNKLITILGLLLISFTGMAATITAKQNGNWDNNSTWDLNRVPDNADIVIIPLGRTVTINNPENDGDDLTIRVYGVLKLNGGKLRIGDLGAIWVYAGGMITSSSSASETIKIDNTEIFKGSVAILGSVVGPQKAIGSLASLGFVPFTSLPVKFVAFTAVRNDADILVQWSTADEVNSYMYEVQRSFNGINFNTIAYVAGAGTSSALNRYSFTDKNINAAVAYYRIKQVDLDGQFTYTAIRTVINAANPAQAVAISGTEQKIVVQFTGSAKIQGTITLQLIAMNGQVVSQQNLTGTTGQIIINTRYKGHYVVALSNGQDFKAAKQIIL